MTPTDPRRPELEEDAPPARLAAHAAGVARGREVTGTPAMNGSTVETTEDVTP